VSRADVLLVTAADERYAGPAALALISAARSTALPVRCALLLDEVSKATARRIDAAFARACVALDVFDLSPASLGSLPGVDPRNRTAFAPLFLSRVVGALPERVLWIDADTLTVAPIDDLLSLGLDGCAVAAVQDAAVPFASSPSGVHGWRRLGVLPSAGYFNSGLMLIDTKLWIEQHIEERALELVRASPEETAFHDQSPLNAVVAGDWTPLAPHWNARPRNKYTIGLGGWIVSRGGLRRPPPACVVHWAGHPKPWDPRHPPSPDRTRYLRAWSEWLTEFPLTVSALHAQWYVGRARRLLTRNERPS
jgi:lipopolysaccharide biosynthesis glycosyltransferase